MEARLFEQAEDLDESLVLRLVVGANDEVCRALAVREILQPRSEFGEFPVSSGRVLRPVHAHASIGGDVENERDFSSARAVAGELCLELNLLLPETCEGHEKEEQDEDDIHHRCDLKAVVAVG